MPPGPFLHAFARPAAERDEFLTIVRGEGAAVWDAAGRRYVDGLASLWYCQIGHGRESMAEAVADQLRTLDAYHTFDMFTNEPAEAFCAEVAALAPMPDARVFLACSGSESVDTALKIARLVAQRRGDTERRVILARRHAYHGTTYGGVTAQGLPLNREGWGPLLDEVHHVDHDDLASVEEAFAQHAGRVAALIAEPVIGAGGVRPPAPGYLEGLRRLCDEHGALLIVDEVICGFGRLGRWFACDHYDVEPDLVTFAKGATSGYQPLGGVIVGRAVREVLEADPDFVLRTGFTYSGHPASCRAGVENLRILREERLLERAPHIGARLGPGLVQLVEDGLAADARGVAGIWAVDVPEAVSALDVRAGLLERGVIVRPIGTTTIALCPPLVIDDDDLDLCLAALREALTVCSATSA